MRIALLLALLTLDFGAAQAQGRGAEGPEDAPDVVSLLANDWRWDLAGDAL